MHRLLERQLRRHRARLAGRPELRAFIEAIDEAYRQTDADRVLLERSLELSSKELKQSNSQMRAMMQALPDLFLRLDAQNMILDCKGAKAAAVIGPVPEVFVGKRLDNSLLAPLAEMLDEGRRQLTTATATASVEAALAIGGAERWYEARIVPLPEGEILALVRDITDRKIAEEAKFAHAQKMEAIGRLAGGIAHDFNNLLTVIQGRGEALLERLAPGSTNHQDASLVLLTAERAAALTKQLLAFSRKQVLAPKVFDLNVVVSGMIAMLQRLIGEDIEVVTALSAGLSGVRADPGQIEQVILNLAVNARDAMPHGGTLTIATADVGAEDVRAHVPGAGAPYVMLAVRDTGHGMDQATRSRIFEPFFTTKEPGKGTGLGLATVYGIVEQSGGHVAVESEPGHGATFFVYLPRVDDAVESPVAATPAAAAPARTGTVLVVEDEREVRSLVVDILERAGYEVLVAAEGEEALRRSAEHQGPVALLLTDVVMPRMSGADLAAAVTTKRPETRVLYMSGYVGKVDQDTLQEDASFIAKPFMPRELLAKVREVLSASR
jgi:signal transduction histidine kinase